MNFDSLKLSRLVERYEAGEAVILVARADEHLSLVDHPNQPATGALNITMYRTDHGYSQAVDQFSIPAQPDQTLSELMNVAVSKTQKKLTTSWKSRTATQTSEASSLDAIVPIQSLADWTDIQRNLGRTHIITKITLKSLTPKAARITLDFQGTPQRLSLALDQVNLILGRNNTGFVDGRPSDSYTLTRRRSRQSRLNIPARPYGDRPIRNAGPAYVTPSYPSQSWPLALAPPRGDYAQTF